jgi:DNA-binding FadR family transcriptional regulator
MSFTEIGDKRSLSEKVLDAVTRSILSGEWAEGEAMPTEPELAGQFGVSRSVIRDAARMLVAKGLVEVRRGKGMYVASSPTKAFAEALVLALRRRKASAWDVEEFHALLLPEIFALAARRATETEKAGIREAAEAYVTAYAELSSKPETEEGRIRCEGLFAAFAHRVFAASGNGLCLLLGDVLVRLRGFRDVDTEEGGQEALRRLVDSETRIMRGLAEAVTGGDPEAAREKAAAFLRATPAARRRLEETPVGEMPRLSLDMLGTFGEAHGT